MNGPMMAWKCENGHTLGQVMRNGSGIQQLLLYRLAVDPTPTPPQNGEPCFGEGSGNAEVDVIAVVEGYTADVKCSVCGGIRSWFPGPEAIKRMVRQFEKMKR